MPTNVIMPALELAQETGKVLRWMKAPGDKVRKGEPIVEIETDKVTVEIEAPASGVLRDVTANEGDVVPVGRTIKLLMTSQDVIHSFFIPGFRIKEDVLPGRYTTQWFTPTRIGTYELFCAQYCGTNHALMIGRVIVLDPTAFAEWLRRGEETVSVAQTGERLFRSFGCSGCHSPGASVRAPLLQSIFNSPVPLQDGRIVRSDERYIRDSILLPNTEIVAGYDPVMPSFQGRLSEEELFALITYIKSLGSSQQSSTNAIH